MRRFLFSACLLCAVSTVSAKIYHTGIVEKVGDNYYSEFWDDEDESDEVRVELECFGSNVPDTLFVPSTIDWGGQTAYVDMVDGGFFSSPDNLKAVVVDGANRSLSSHDGVLFSKDGTRLLGWPKGKDGSFTIKPEMQLDFWLLNDRPLLTAILADESDTRFSSRDGVLFTKDGTQLLVCPGGKEGAYAVPQGVTTIAGSAFKGCSRLTEVRLPATVSEIGAYAFQGCRQMRSVNIPEGVRDLESELFAHCEQLQALEIPTTVSHLGYNVFWDCMSLRTLTIPAGVTSMEYNALWYDYGMTDIQVDEANPVYKSIDGIVYTKDGSRLVHCPCGRTGKVTIAEGTTTLDHSFYCCKKLEEVVIPACVEKIGESTFSNCNSLRSIYTERTEPVAGKVQVFWPSSDNFWLPSVCTVYVPLGCKDAYQRQDEDNWWSRFWIEEYEVTGIAEAAISPAGHVVARYGLDGRQTPGWHGLQIERRSDGTARKVIVKP